MNSVIEAMQVLDGYNCSIDERLKSDIAKYKDELLKSSKFVARIEMLVFDLDTNIWHILSPSSFQVKDLVVLIKPDGRKIPYVIIAHKIINGSPAVRIAAWDRRDAYTEIHKGDIIKLNTRLYSEGGN
jgi:hypothetical protein